MTGVDGTYRLDVDSARLLIRATLEGYWSVIIATRYSQDILQAIENLSKISGGKQVRLFVDARKQNVQSQEVVKILAESVTEFEGGLPKVAVLMSSTLHKMQSSRIVPQELQRIFDSESKALEWLFQI